MKIAQIAPIWYSIPPKKYGGTESVISILTEQLVKKGHNVTLFATKDSQTNSHLVSFFEKGIAEEIFPTNREFFLYPLIHFIKSIEVVKKNQFDIVHCHLGTLADYILLALTYNLPNVIFTAHIQFPTESTQPLRWQTLNLFKNIPFISISNNQRGNLNLNFIKTIYHGIKIEDFTFEEIIYEKENSGYIFWISRLSQQKGIVEAIKVSKKTHKKLFFTSAINSKFDEEYYNQYIKPYLTDPEITFIQELNPIEKSFYFRHAKLFLFPIQWEEPFGLVMIESMACGTPVVAFARGSVPEVIKDGETGFIVNPSNDDIRGDFIIKKTGIEGLCEAVERIYSMPEEQYRKMRKACREHVEKNFTVEKMVDEYEKIYKEILNKKTS